MSKRIGPELPPHLLAAADSADVDDGVLLLHDSNDGILSDDSSVDSESDSSDSYGPTLPSLIKSKTSVLPSSKPVELKSKHSNDSKSDDISCNTYGPALPPHLKPKTNSPSSTLADSTTRKRVDDSESDNKVNNYGPALPPIMKTKSSVPSLKTALVKTGLHSDDSESDSEVDTYGPALPPNLKPKPLLLSPESADTKTDRHSNDSKSDNESNDRYGPTLPPNYQPKPVASSSSAGNVNNKRVFVIGPALPPGMLPNTEEEESEDEVVGPMPLPEGFESNPAYIQEQMEKRAERMRRKLRGEEEADSGEVRRDTWMTELPPDRASEFGLGPRQFRARAKLDPGDRSVWTDTPEDALRKQITPVIDDSSTVDEMQQQVIAERDKAMQKYTDKHNKKKRKESLVDMHQKKLKKKQKKEEEKLKDKKKERRPFDRDVDLQANRFDEAQKKAILRKAQMLDDRFSRGASKFL